MSRPVTSEEIRQAFLDFYQEMGHTVVPSSPLPLYDNPTLFFTNAGMNQFVNTFLGKEERPYKRAATAQKCMRVQGKHNDLENVGPSPRHHTFFEMLGNFSFGDYFKAGAIRYGFDFMTKVCQIPVEKLWYTVHTSDDEAYNIWVNEMGVPAERVLRMGDKTNFWMMGEIGPCGPTSEIHYDWGAEHCTCDDDDKPNCGVLLDNGCRRWLEVWNLVFMQYNRDENGVQTPLPKPGVDTGMGLERITSVQQQQIVNYETDLFTPAMDRVQQLLNHTAEERAHHWVGYRVIADHGRAATFMIGDGVAPGNVGGSYVLRMIIRRAARYGRKVGFTQPFLGEVAQAYIEKMGDIYPELRQRREHIVRTVTREEEKFADTLDNALNQLDKILAELDSTEQKEIPGKLAFKLHDTHGLPLEITRDVAKERGYTVDETGFKEAQEAHRIASGAGLIKGYEVDQNVYGLLFSQLVESNRLDWHGVEYDPYSGAKLEGELLGLIRDGAIVERATAGEKVQVVTASTPFYVEAGGEVSDTGRILIPETGSEIRVDDTRMPVPGLVVHFGEVVRGEVAVGQTAVLEVNDERRWDIRRNHTATHLLHRELRAHLGTHVFQKGSLVAPDRLRFDFTHGQAVGKEQLAAVEMAINEAILANRPVNIEYMGQKDAVSAGAMALFGEKYGDTVRTIQIGKRPNLYSFELCGGLHVRETGDIGLFHFVGEEAVSAGVRRVEAVTGRGAQQMITERLNTLERLAHKLNTPVAEVETRLESLLADNRAMQKEVEQLRRRLAKGQFDALLGRMQAVDGVSLVTAVVDAADMDGLREMADWFRDRVESGVAVLAAVKEERPMLITVVTDDLVNRGVKAGDIAREVAAMIGGSGGGRPNMAQAGGKDASKLPEALAAVPGLIEKAIK
jgi:alanyl-tRNA synthetase